MTQYARSGDLHIAYQELGEGPPDIVFVAPYITHVEAMWEIPRFSLYLQGLARIGRLVLFDALGSGLSDPLPGLRHTLDSWTNDVRVVMDAVDLERAAIHGFDSAGAMSMLFAASHPERVSALILINTFAKVIRADDYPAGLPEPLRDRFLDWWHPQWGTGSLLSWYSPSGEFSHEDRDRQARFERQIASPGAALEHMRFILDMDVRETLPLIQTPTLVLHRQDNEVIRVEHGRYLGESIPGAKYVELPGDEHMLIGDFEPLLDEIREFLTGIRVAPVTDRVLATILFTDIVGSTERAAEVGDRRWGELLREHDRMIRDAVARFQGDVVKSTGDGAMAMFDGPARAIEAARAIASSARGFDIQVRAGLHTGECELLGDDVGGIAVHIASRIADLADGGELLVSRTVKDLVVGSEIEFVDRGVAALRGVPDDWQLFAVAKKPSPATP